jgi:hypothetical protein
MREIAQGLLRLARSLLAEVTVSQGDDYRHVIGDAIRRGDSVTFLYRKKDGSTRQVRIQPMMLIGDKGVRGTDLDDPAKTPKVFMFEGIGGGERTVKLPEPKPEREVRQSIPLEEKKKQLLAISSELQEVMNDNDMPSIAEKTWHILYKIVSTGEAGKVFLGYQREILSQGYSDSFTYRDNPVWLHVNAAPADKVWEKQHYRFNLDVGRGRTRWDE